MVKVFRFTELIHLLFTILKIKIDTFERFERVKQAKIEKEQNFLLPRWKKFLLLVDTIIINYKMSHPLINSEYYRNK